MNSCLPALPCQARWTPWDKGSAQNLSCWELEPFTNGLLIYTGDGSTWRNWVGRCSWFTFFQQIFDDMIRKHQFVQWLLITVWLKDFLFYMLNTMRLQVTQILGKKPWTKQFHLLIRFIIYKCHEKGKYKTQTSTKDFWKIWKWVEIKCDNLIEGERKKEMEMLEELKNKLMCA